MQPRRGADRRTLASAAVSPAQSGRKDDTTRLPTREAIAQKMAELEELRAPFRKERAADIVAMAETWIGKHPEAYAYIERRFLEEARAERPVSMRALLEEVRQKALDGSTRGVKVNNLITSVLARKMREKHPEEARFLTFRHAIVDELED